MDGDKQPRPIDASLFDFDFCTSGLDLLLHLARLFLVTPSLIVFGAPSTSAFASAKPSPGTAPRTSLITAILFAPISFKITSNVVFSSAAGAAAPPAAPAAEPAATATGAAALTPHFSSSCLTNPAISSTDRL